jgi:hypothetical protein
LKRNILRNFVTEINQYTSQSYIWEKISKLKNTWNWGMQLNEYKEEKTIAVEQGIHNLCPPWVETEQPVIGNVNGDPFLDTPLDIEELNSATDRVKVESSPGLDGVDYKVIKNLPEGMRKVLLALYNELPQTGGFPNDWKQYAVFFIPKAYGKTFRSITLAPCLLKILERIINCRLNWWLEHHKELSDPQFGSQTNKSCVDSLALMYSDIVNAFDNNKIVGALFLDIKAAHDNILVNILIERLAKMKIPKLMLKLIYNVTSEIHLSINLDTIDMIRGVTHDLPPGSVLSPLLYNICMVSLDKSVKGIYKVLQFADNVAIYTMDTNPEEALPKLKNSARELSRYLNDSGL